MKIIGISGVARSGKDTLCELLREGLAEFGHTSKRLALADALKQKMRQFLLDSFDIDIFNCSAKEKELVRPLLVEFGRAKRIISNGSYWTDLLQKEIDKDDCKFAIVTDIRYSEYEKDEAQWIQHKNKGVLVHVEKTLSNNQILLPVNVDESKNDPKVKRIADFRFEWKDGLISAKEKADGLLEEILKKLI